jgi:AraC-like DNA-binding protein
MSAVSFAPSPILQALHFTDIDEFRRSVRKFCVEFTPLVRKISVQQAILNLAAFDIVFVQSFPRIADTQLVANTTAICLTMDDDEPVRFNGVDVDQAVIGIGHGGSGFSIAEKTGARLAVINFSPEIHDRGWPDTRPHFLHRYLRLKRLWLVRKRLLTGQISVKACALEYGFWHMGDFSRGYQAHFGETPSQTLAQAR